MNRRCTWLLGLLAYAGCADDLGQTDGTTESTGANEPTTSGPAETSIAPSTGSESQTTSGADGTSTGAPEGTSSSGDTAPPGTACCEAHAGAGCEDAELQACVCGIEVGCCAFDWDFTCATIAEDQCGGCGASGTSSTGGGSSSSSGSSSGGFDTDGGLACCETSPRPGCDNREVEICVCGLDEFCCMFEWDQSCVNLTDFCGVDCPSDTSTGEPAEGDCCSAHEEVGCNDAAVEECVCAIDGFCCRVTWDDICVDEALNICAADCIGDETDSGGTDTEATDTGDTGIPGGNCCEVQLTPGCEVPEIEACVCVLDSFCCDAQWDEICVSEAENPCGADCSGDTDSGVSTSTGLVSSSGASSGGDAGDCCLDHPAPGCEDPEIETCVCTIDTFCCDTVWDGLCVNEAIADCGAAC